jgi:hypothetical protein
MNLESGSTTAFGTIWFLTKQEAIEALVQANHCKINANGISNFIGFTCIVDEMYLYELAF